MQTSNLHAAGLNANGLEVGGAGLSAGVFNSQIDVQGTSGSGSPNGVLINGIGELGLIDSQVSVNNAISSGAGLTSAVTINSTGETTILNSQLNATGNQANGLILQSASMVDIADSQINVTGTTGEANGVLGQASSPSITAENLTVNLSNTDASSNTTGLHLLASGSAQIQGGQFTVNAARSRGFEADNSSSINAVGSIINVTGDSTVLGVAVRDTALLTVEDLSITVTSTSGPGMVPLYAVLFASNNANNRVRNTQGTVIGNAGGGVLAEANGIGNVENSTFNVTGATGNLDGILTQGSGGVTATGSSFTVINLEQEQPMLCIQLEQLAIFSLAMAF